MRIKLIALSGRAWRVFEEWHIICDRAPKITLGELARLMGGA